MHYTWGCKATELQEEAIAIRVVDPSETHVKAYIIAVGGDSLKLQSPHSEEEGEPTHPMIILTQVGKCCIISKWSLATSSIMSCISLWRISIRSHSVSWMHSSAAPHQCLGDTHQRADCWRGWPGGHLSERGRVGSPRTTIPVSYPCMTRWRMVPLGPPPPPRLPAQPNPNMGHLINNLDSGLQLGTPRINTFSGEAMPSKTQVSFEQWNNEVQCIKDHYLELMVWESIVRSLKGAVADMVHYMGPTTSVSNIL